MPQMAPLNWLMLFMFFIMMFLVINALVNFLTISPIKPWKKELQTKSTYWKW
uniref:ATP synthase complex subunit 8 n=2 Tax=unclassified Bostrichoidea TaxID=1050298 RepID=A0A343A6P9_9COLE|nr:ATP synthase F0 subunit 8 [Bostrichoidea sp. KM-2015]AXS65322.1 ATP synthase F0 subunit 8 [Bostrichoidea sp. 8 KM-2017]